MIDIINAVKLVRFFIHKIIKNNINTALPIVGPITRKRQFNAMPPIRHTGLYIKKIYDMIRIHE